MPFFSQFPQLSYDVCDDGIRTSRYDIFRHVDVTDLRTDDYTTYLYYNIKEGDRPDIISQKLYNTPDYYWTFFIINDFLQEGFNAWYKSSDVFSRGLDNEYENTGAIFFIPTWSQRLNQFGNLDTIMENSLNGIDFTYDELRIYKVGDSPENIGKVRYWDPYMLTAIIEDTSVDFFDDNATYRFMFTENATNEDKFGWLDGYSTHLESVIVGDTFNLKESDLADNVYTEYTPTKTFSNVLLAPYRFNAFANPPDSPPLAPDPDTQATFETGDRLGTYDAIVKGMGSFDIDNYTYFEWEYERNEANRQIRYVRPEYITRFAEEYKRLINL